jgi:predicted enzyme related to lactoylglutathione lyase
MIQPSPSPVVHLELHTGNLARACAFYARVCGWRLERLEVGGRSYQALDWGGGLDGGIVECGTSRALWMPYLEIPQIDEATERARRFGASVLFQPREGPAGWRSVVQVPEGGEIAFWQSKTRADGR